MYVRLCVSEGESVCARVHIWVCVTSNMCSQKETRNMEATAANCVHGTVYSAVYTVPRIVYTVPRIVYTVPRIVYTVPRIPHAACVRALSSRALSSRCMRACTLAACVSSGALSSGVLALYV